MKYEKYLIIDAPNANIAQSKIDSLESLSKTTDSDTLNKIAELMQKEGACERFNNLLNNSFVKSLLK